MLIELSTDTTLPFTFTLKDQSLVGYFKSNCINGKQREHKENRSWPSFRPDDLRAVLFQPPTNKKHTSRQQKTNKFVYLYNYTNINFILIHKYQRHRDCHRIKFLWINPSLFRMPLLLLGPIFVSEFWCLLSFLCFLANCISNLGSCICIVHQNILFNAFT
jgi:hypothetical protein